MLLIHTIHVLWCFISVLELVHVFSAPSIRKTKIWVKKHLEKLGKGLWYIFLLSSNEEIFPYEFCFPWFGLEGARRSEISKFTT